MLHKIYHTKGFIFTDLTVRSVADFPTKEENLKDVNVKLSELDFRLLRRLALKLYTICDDFCVLFLQWYVKLFSVCTYNVLYICMLYVCSVYTK